MGSNGADEASSEELEELELADDDESELLEELLSLDGLAPLNTLAPPESVSAGSEPELPDADVLLQGSKEVLFVTGELLGFLGVYSVFNMYILSINHTQDLHFFTFSELGNTL